MPGKLKTRTETYIGNFVIDRGPHLAEFRKNKGILTAPFMRESTFFKEKAKGHRMHLLTDGWHLHRCFWPGSETLIPALPFVEKEPCFSTPLRPVFGTLGPVLRLFPI